MVMMMMVMMMMVVMMMPMMMVVVVMVMMMTMMMMTHETFHFLRDYYTSICQLDGGGDFRWLVSSLFMLFARKSVRSS